MGSNSSIIEKEGVVTETLPDGKFKIKLNNEDKEILGYLCGKMRKFDIRVLVGDKVKVELSIYDETNGRIVYRFK